MVDPSLGHGRSFVDCWSILRHYPHIHRSTVTTYRACRTKDRPCSENLYAGCLFGCEGVWSILRWTHRRRIDQSHLVDQVQRLIPCDVTHESRSAQEQRATDGY